MSAATLLPIVNSAFITIGVGFVAYIHIKASQNKLSAETIQILRDNISAKDGEIIKMKAEHDSAIAGLKAQIAVLTSQVEGLNQANIVLQNTVTGKDTLNMIVDIMKPIPDLFAPGGFIEEVRKNQQSALSQLAEIRNTQMINTKAI